MWIQERATSGQGNETLYRGREHTKLRSQRIIRATKDLRSSSPFPLVARLLMLSLLAVRWSDVGGSRFGDVGEFGDVDFVKYLTTVQLIATKDKLTDPMTIVVVSNLSVGASLYDGSTGNHKRELAICKLSLGASNRFMSS